MNKIVAIEGEISMSTIFVGPFEDAEEMFYSFKIDDGTDAILGFAAKNKGAAALRSVLLKSGDATIWTKVKVQILGRYGRIVYGSIIDFVNP